MDSFVRPNKIQLLSMNLIKIVLHKSDGIMINLMDKNINEVIWSEKIIAQELYTKVLYNVERFIKEIQKQKSNYVLQNGNIFFEYYD